MKNYGKIFALILALAMMLSLAACGGSGSAPASEAPAAEAPASDAPAPEAPAEAPAAPEAPAPEAPPEAPSEAPAATLSYPIAEPVTLTMAQIYNPNASAVFGNGDYTECYTYKKIAENTGITVEFEMLAETTYTTNLDLMIASGEYPDLFGRSIGSYDSNNMKAVEDGVVLDLAGIVEEMAPDWYNIIKSDTTYGDGLYNSDGTLCKAAGRTISMTTSGLLIRQDWLDELGLSIPSTIDDLTEVLRSFKTAYDCPMSILINCELDSGIVSAFNTNSMGFRNLTFQLDAPDSGKIVCSLASDGYVEYLLKLHEWYAEGLINADFVNISKENQNFEPYYLTGKSGVWNDDAKNAIPASADDPDWAASAFVLDQSNCHLVRTIDGGGVGMVQTYISGTCQNVEAAMALINYGFTPEGMDLIALGEKDVTYTEDESGKVAYTELITNNPDGYTSEQAKYFYLTDAWMPTDQQQRVLEMSVTPEALEAYDVWSNAEGGDGSMLLPDDFELTPDQFSQVMEKGNDIVTLFNENAAKVIFGEMDEAGYRAVIETAYTTGLAEVTGIYQSAYEEYLAEQ